MTSNGKPISPIKGCNLADMFGTSAPPFVFSAEETKCCDERGICESVCGSDFLKCEDAFRTCLKEKTPDGSGLWISGFSMSQGCPSFIAVR